MNISALMDQNFGQYLTLLSNPTFLNAVKSAAGGADDSGKYDALFANLEKLSSLLSQSNSDNSTGASGAGASTTSSSSLTSMFGGLLSPGSTSSTDPLTGSQQADAAQQLNKMEVDALGQIADQLIANADLMESALNLDVTPADEELIGLFQKLRDIIAKLDTDTRKLQQEVKDKEVKSELKLRPSASTKSGFEEGLTLLAK